ncbi:hypothetical protein Micbo1qcDRAFT_164166 [Microdochium bolleyi]|uniref:Uncharacterized protein n=1 Tax=Microdochium bolleyi TaxID=196109 RepID=A0A136J0C3_9PEZI|nr:hypothetical protein Micbo1qcDRAFT_164166 [Microdochium bolleyi]
MEFPGFEVDPEVAHFLHPSDAFRQSQATLHPTETNDKILLEPNPETQDTYNRLRDQLVADKLKALQEPSPLRRRPSSLSSKSRVTTDETGSSPSDFPSPYPDHDDGRSPGGHYHSRPRSSSGVNKHTKDRGKRVRPLELETRFHAAFIRKLKLVCEGHKERKVKCDCHDLRLFEATWSRLRTNASTESGGQSAEKTPFCPVAAGVASDPPPAHVWPVINTGGLPFDESEIPIVENDATILDEPGLDVREDITDLVGQWQNPNLIPSGAHLLQPSSLPRPIFLPTALPTIQIDPTPAEYETNIGSGHTGFPAQRWICQWDERHSLASPNFEACFRFFPSMYALHNHFQLEHWQCPIVHERYRMQCTQCWEDYATPDPPDFPNNGYCSCDRAEQGTRWTLKFVRSSQESWTTEHESSSVPTSGYGWGNTLSSSSSYSAYDYQASNFDCYNSLPLPDHDNGMGYHGYSCHASGLGNREKHSGYCGKTNTTGSRLSLMLKSIKGSPEFAKPRTIQELQPKLNRSREPSGFAQFLRPQTGSVIDATTYRCARRTLFESGARNLPRRLRKMLSLAAWTSLSCLLFLIVFGTTRPGSGSGQRWQQHLAI